MRVLGVITNVAVGMRDCRQPCISFTLSSLEGCSLQIFEGERMLSFIRNVDKTNVLNLNGCACICEEDDGLLDFVELFKVLP